MNATSEMPCMTRKCDACGRKEGAKVDRCGEYDGVPLGSFARCQLCSQLVCPECIDDGDCCFTNEDYLNGDIDAPPGWAVVPDHTGPGVVYARTSVPGVVYAGKGTQAEVPA